MGQPLNLKIDLVGLAVRLEAKGLETSDKELRKLTEEVAEALRQAEQVLLSVPPAMEQVRAVATSKTAAQIAGIMARVGEEYEAGTRLPKTAGTALKEFAGSLLKSLSGAADIVEGKKQPSKLITGV